jgi:hypothetical protein
MFGCHEDARSGTKEKHIQRVEYRGPCVLLSPVEEDGEIDRHWPRLGAVTALHENFVKREFDSGTRGVK